eukprot:CAMPEP_0173135026 /NCGR_PEP_ID=MMETSP1105-20130129/1647_1 /TAXON_ID=2985 /ORGANISM="Ochromonas sp., Strain BG-1" /LENGTH=631 /DNA_ID=CAMNT_0014046947 /DNA_START=163 /DNA_END=2058 /DNA_ORIENTATION=-
MKSDDKIVQLENELDTHKINKLTLFELEQQNLQLLERIKELQSKIQELEIENSFLSQHKQDKILLEEKQLLKLQELELKLPYENSQLISQLNKCNDVIHHQRSVIEELTSQNTSFYQMMQWKEEIKNEQLSRAKLAEYQTLIELDLKERENNNLEREQKVLMNDHQVMLQKSREMDKQLTNSFQQIDELNNLYSRVIHTLEEENYLASYKEKLLVKENYLLQASKQLLADVVDKTTDPLSSLAREIRKSQSRLYSPSSTKHPSVDSPSVTNMRKSFFQEGSNRKNPKTQLSKTMNAIQTNRRDRKSTITTKGSLHEESSKPRPNTTADILPSRNHPSEPSNFTSTSSPKFGVSLSPSIISSEEELAQLPNSPSIQFSDHQEYIAFSSIKHSIINKYLSLFIEYCQFYQFSLRSGSFPKVSTKDIDNLEEVVVYQGKLLLNNCGLNSDDMNLLIDWLRRTSSKSINLLDLRDNHIDKEGFEKLLLWIISWSEQETQRTSPAVPLQIDLRGNQISPQTLSVVSDLVKTNRSFVYVSYKDDEDKTLQIYSKVPRSLDDSFSPNCDDEENHSQYSISVVLNLNGQYRRAITRKHLELQESFTNRVVGSLYTTEEMSYHQNNVVYPRDHIMRDRIA